MSYGELVEEYPSVGALYFTSEAGFDSSRIEPLSGEYNKRSKPQVGGLWLSPILGDNELPEWCEYSLMCKFRTERSVVSRVMINEKAKGYVINSVEDLQFLAMSYGIGWDSRHNDFLEASKRYSFIYLTERGASHTALIDLRKGIYTSLGWDIECMLVLDPSIITGSQLEADLTAIYKQKISQLKNDVYDA